MTIPVWPGGDRDVERETRLSIVAVFVIGLRRRNPGAVVNSISAFVGTYLPTIVESTFDVEFKPWQRSYIGLAMVTHAAGMLGPYDNIKWWDHLTHTLSSSILGGFVYAAAKRRGRDPGPLVIGVVGILGLFWEALEYLIHTTANRLDLEPVLVFYSRKDTVLDLIFNLVGPLLVLCVGDEVLSNLLETDE